MWNYYWFRTFVYPNTKGQLILKCLFSVFNSPTKGTKTIRLEVPQVVKLNFIIQFLGQLKIPKRHFEINWPLIVCKFNIDFSNILIPLCCCFSCKSIICVLNLKSNFSYLYFLAINEILSNDRAFIFAPSAEWGLLNTNRSRIFRALRVFEACLVLTSSIMPNECCDPNYCIIFEA